MLTATYVFMVGVSALLAGIGCAVPALLIAGVATLVVFRHDIARWLRLSGSTAKVLPPGSSG